MKTLVRILGNYGRHPALALDGHVWSYADVLDRAADLAALVQARDAKASLIGILANKSFTAYAAALAAHLGSKGYVPLNVKFPAQRLAEMLVRSGARTLIVDQEGLRRLDQLLSRIGRESCLTIIGLELDSFGGLDGMASGHRFLLLARAGGLRDWPGLSAGIASNTAYLLFTSGTTGTPKGLPVSFANLDAYVSHISERFPLLPTDRASQTFDLTFDLSVHDIFATWAAGACLYPLTDTRLLNPAQFIREAGLTAWFSVPSVAMLMADSRVVNLYGPTETTIAIAAHEWDVAARRQTAREGIVPIGRVFPTQRFCLLAANGSPLPEGPGRGELCLNGSQVTAGYLAAEDKTAEQYLALPKLGPGFWYRTGDLVEMDGEGILHFLGRVDNQVKINGYRVELGEVEAALRAASGAQMVVALPWAAGTPNAQALVAFIVGRHQDAGPILNRCRDALPDYMVPTRIIWKPSLPLTMNGKIDRRTLADELAAEGYQGR